MTDVLVRGPECAVPGVHAGVKGWASIILIDFKFSASVVTPLACDRLEAAW